MKILSDTTHNGIRRVTVRSYALVYIAIFSGVLAYLTTIHI